MKVSDFDRLSKLHLLPALPNWEGRRGVLFMKPVGQCLCTVGFITSTFAKDCVYMDASVKPLYLPPGRDSYRRLKRIKRQGGLRLAGSEEEMRHVLDAIVEHAIPFIQAADMPQKIASALDQTPQVKDPYELEGIAMSCVHLGNKEGAKRALARAVEVLVEDGREWCRTMSDRLRAMNDRIEPDFEAFASPSGFMRRGRNGGKTPGIGISE